MTANNLKNWVQQPGADLDNIAHFEGSVIFSGTSTFTGNSVYNSVTFTATQIQAALSASPTIVLNNIVTAYSAPGAIAIAGKAVVAGGTGLAMTLAAPTQYALCDINLLSISSGNLVVTCAAGVTFDGTNNTATFNAAADRLVIGYKSATQWEIFLNNSVV